MIKRLKRVKFSNPLKDIFNYFIILPVDNKSINYDGTNRSKKF